MGKKSFVLYTDYRQHLEILSDQERGQLLVALFDYVDGIEPKGLAGATLMAFSFIRAQIDRDTEKWETARQAKVEAGKLGGLKSGETRRNKAELNTEKQNEANKAGALYASEIKANEAVTVNVTATVNENVNANVTKQPPPSISPQGEKQQSVPFEKIMNLYNQTCVSFPRILRIDGQRQKAVAARWKANSNIETFETLFKKTEASSFLKGKNDRNWRADFDWITKATNMTKVLEGRYDDKSTNKLTQEENTKREHNFDGWVFAGDDEGGRS